MKRLGSAWLFWSLNNVSYNFRRLQSFLSLPFFWFRKRQVNEDGIPVFGIQCSFLPHMHIKLFLHFNVFMKFEITFIGFLFRDCLYGVNFVKQINSSFQSVDDVAYLFLNLYSSLIYYENGTLLYTTEKQFPQYIYSLYKIPFFTM